MAPYSSIFAWKIPWTEEPGRLQSMGSLESDDWATSLSLFTFMHWRRKWQPTPVFLPGESQRTGEPGGLPSMGLHRVRHDWSDLAAAAAAAHVMKLPEKPKRPEFRKLLGWEIWEIWGQWQPGESIGSSSSFPHTFPCASLPSGCFWVLFFYHKLLI